MSLATHSVPEHEPEAAPAARQKLFRRVAFIHEPKPADPKSDFRLRQICEEGAFFCSRCIKYQLTQKECGKCGKLMRWNPPIF